MENVGLIDHWYSPACAVDISLSHAVNVGEYSNCCVNTPTESWLAAEPLRNNLAVRVCEPVRWALLHLFQF